MRLKRILLAVLAAAIVASLFAVLAIGVNEEFEYVYILKAGMDGTINGTVTLDLFVTVQNKNGNDDHDTPPGPFLDGGAFALKFPEWFQGDMRKVVFTKGDNVSTYCLVPIQRTDAATYADTVIKQETYQAFGWTSKVTADGVTKNWTWLNASGINHWGTKIGTFTIALPDKDTLPGASDVGQLNWMDAAEAIAVEIGETVGVDMPNPNDEYNRIIWNNETKLYQGYWTEDEPITAEEATMRQVDIGFSFDAPSAWTHLLKLLSYDPKKPASWELYKTDGTLVATDKSTPIVWDTADTTAIKGAAGNANSGIGYYQSGAVLGTAGQMTRVEMVNPGNYKLKILKPGHLPTTTDITVKTINSLADAVLSDEVAANGIRLLVGDINPWEENPDGNGPVQHYGDGRIDMQDRSAMLSVMGQPAEANYLAYHADLDGDGRVTMADLSILMSPENYAHSAD